MIRSVLRRAGAAAGACLTLAACVSFPPAPPARERPRLEDDAVVVADGARLPLAVTRAEAPTAALLVLHGMNDYSGFVRDAAAFWAARGIAVYAYDQRGFGGAPDRGRWPGADTLAADLRAAVSAARADAPDLPLYVLGHSMGAAVTLVAMDDGALAVDGVVLEAPAVWGGARMPAAYRLSINVAAALAPGKTATGGRAGRQASDNIEALRAMAADPMLIKETRMDAALGVVRLMGAAWEASARVGGRVLLLIGEKDEVIPVDAMAALTGRLCGDVALRRYPDGWHLLLRDLQRETVWRDVADWVLASAAALRADTKEKGPQARRAAAGPADPVCRGDRERGAVAGRRLTATADSE